ncbi:MAG: NUDIX domain-containing protein [Devosia sp.]|nr:NUDIX domain-containing protein [Devosia sp.]
MEANAASVALLDRGKVLLIQRAFEPYAGLWTLPGGRREPGETIENTAIREIREELGLEIFALRPVMAMRLNTGFVLQVFATESFEGQIAPSPEVTDHRWLRPDDSAALPTTPGLDEVLERAFAPFDRS